MNAFINTASILTTFGWASSNNDDTLIENVPDDLFTSDADIGHWQYVGPTGADWITYTPPANYVPANTNTRTALMYAAEAATYGLIDGYVSGILADADKAVIEAWAPYKLALAKIDLTLESPVWPTPPA